MLVLSRHLGESIYIDGGIVVKVVRIAKGCVRLGITAPADTVIKRAELMEQTGEVGPICSHCYQDCAGSYYRPSLMRDDVLCDSCAAAAEREHDTDYAGPMCLHCRKPVSAATGRQQPCYSGNWLCDECAAAAEREWDARREQRRYDL